MVSALSGLRQGWYPPSVVLQPLRLHHPVGHWGPRFGEPQAGEAEAPPPSLAWHREPVSDSARLGLACAFQRDAEG
eukprot:14219068-Alexandrium_andersonii.AAC.1